MRVAWHVSHAPPSHHGANLAWGLMTDDDDNDDGNPKWRLEPASCQWHCVFCFLTIASHHLYLLFLLSFRGGRMVALHTFPSSSKIWLAAASLLLGSSLQLRSVHPTAFLLTFRLASDAVLSCCFHYDFRMTFFGTHIFIYSDIFCCCFLNFYPIL